MSAPVMMMTPMSGAEPCCCYESRGAWLHCPACHSGSHNTGYLLLVIEPAGTTRVYDDHDEAEGYARAAGAVVACLPILSDYRPPTAPGPSVPEPGPAVGRAQLDPAPPPEPDRVLPQLAGHVHPDAWGVERPTPPQQPDPPEPPTMTELVRPYVDSDPDPGPTDDQVMAWNEHNDHAAADDDEPEWEPGGYPVGDRHYDAGGWYYERDREG